MRRLLLILFISLLVIAPLFSEESGTEEGGEIGEKDEKTRPTFALVLGGGGARGFAHVPVIQELERRGIVPDLVVGTSMGALIGGYYASGWTGSELYDLSLDNPVNSLITYNLQTGRMELVTPDSEILDNIASINFGEEGIGSVTGLINDQGINAFVRSGIVKVLDVKDFDELSIPFRAVGTDATTGERVVFSSGPLFTALRSSMSIPLAFPPVMLEDGTYVMDGGMADNLPVSVARDLGADIVLAVDVNDVMYQNEEVDKGKFKTLSGTLDLFTSMMTAPNSRASYPLADFVIAPDVDEYSTMDFTKAEEIMEKGREAVEESHEFFDFLERELEGSDKDFLLYSSRPSIKIKTIDNGSLGGFDKELSTFLAREINNRTMMEFEELLSEIVTEARLKGLSYDIDGEGNIKLIPDYYDNMSGYLAVGAKANLGVYINGVDPAFFGYDAHVSVGAQYFLHERSLFSLGIIFNDGFVAEARYSTPVRDDTYFGVGLDFDYLNLDVSSITTSYDFHIGNDVALDALLGFFYDPHKNFTSSIALAYNWTHLGKFYDPRNQSVPLMGANDIGYLMLQGSIAYNLKQRIGIFATLDAEIHFNVGMDYVYDAMEGMKSFEGKPLLGYSFKGSLDSEVGGGTFKGYVEAELATVRRYPLLKEAFLTTKVGFLTRDYGFLSSGLHLDVPGTKFYIEIGPYAETFMKHKEVREEYWLPPLVSNVPFSLINDAAFGAKIEVGYRSFVGDIYFGVYLGWAIKEGVGCSFLVGIK